MASVLAGKYRLHGVIGSGTFGTVYRAEHVDVGRAVAVRVLEIPPALKSYANEIRKRFMRDAKLLGDLEHPHAVQVLDAGNHEGHVFYVMELLRGRTLEQALRESRGLPETVIYHVALQTLAAVARGHELGLVHANLTPANIMLVPDLAGEEQVKLLDLGVASAFSTAEPPLKFFPGTPQYAAPEQFSRAPTAASDVYSLGLILMEMATGEPAVGSNVVELCAEAHRSKSPWKMPDDTFASPQLRRVIERAANKTPENRYADGTAMLADTQFMTRAATAELPRASAAPPSAPRFADQPGDLVAGKYRLGKLLGSGGFSRVIRATHVDMEREVAIKLLDLEGAVAQAGGTTAADLKARFGREAKMSSQLRHPNTITVFDFGVDDIGRWYIVMELVDGTNLHAAIHKQGRFDPRRAAKIARDCLRSLSEAHHLGFLHRDLKPGNIMLTHDFEGTESVKVLDFGIATVVDMGDTPGTGTNPMFQPMKATRMGTFVGTPQYAAPEQFLGETLTPSTDIYMLGLVLWEMLTGRPAIDADGFGECLKTHLDPSPWRFPESLGIPPGLAQIVYGALEKGATKRYKSASEMADDLDRWLDGTKTVFTPSPTTEERWEPAMEYLSAAAKRRDEHAARAAAASADASGEGERDGLLRGSRDGMTFDPNLDEDFEPEFLKSSKANTDAGDRDDEGPDPSRPQRGQRGGLSSIPAFKEARIELDTSALAPSRPVRRDPVRPEPAAPVMTASGSRPDWAKIGGIVGLIVVGLFVAGTLMNTEEPETVIAIDDPTKVEPMHLEEFENTLREPEQPVEHRYTTEGILGSLSEVGWAARRTTESQALANVHEQGYRITRGDTSLEIRVVTTKGRSVAQKMFEQTNPPIGAVVFENKLVRVFPPQGGPHPAVDDVVKALRRYRDETVSGAKGGR